ncbi:hypothetical protein BGX29_010225 [Mortierella sp. GBA35]|nr:hypothetical protein BGX29_010225 [Mortierella sp. GBA35]
MKFILRVVLATSSLFFVLTASLVKRAPTGPHWDYSGDKTGPDHWGLLDPAYVICDEGLQQSPIDINIESVSRFVTCAKKALTFDYKPLTNALAHFNGFAVEVDWIPNAELHLVHRSPVDNSLAVIGVLLQAQPFNAPFFKYLTALQKKVHADAKLHPSDPTHTNGNGTTSAVIEELLKDSFCAGTQPTGKEATKVDYPLESVDFAPLVRALKGFTPRWEYSGSLTTPPCSENVAWNVMHDPYPIGLDQLRALVDLQGYNAREIEDSRRPQK